MNIVALDGAIAAGGDLNWDRFKKSGNFTLYEHTSPEDLFYHAKDADAVIVNKVIIDAGVLSNLPKLKYIGVIATGYDNVDIIKAGELGITVTNIPGYSSDSVAQNVFALLLEATNHVAEYNRRVTDGEWISIPYVQAVSDKSLRIMELAGKTMAIYGLGNIGMRVAHIAHAFGMKVISPTRRNSESLPEWLEKLDNTSEMFRRADILSLNAPLTPESSKIINKDTLSLMKNNAIIINTARGGLIDHDALNDALNNRTIAAACLDVLDNEPPSKNHCLITNPHCIITPHVAWDSLEARTRLMNCCAENLEKYIAGQPQNVVNKVITQQ